jgi:hypothetical protein
MRTFSDTFSVHDVGRSFLARFAFAFFAAATLVFLATVAVGGRGISVADLAAPAAVTVILAVAGAFISALLVRRSGVFLVLAAQVITVTAIGAWNFFA